MPGRPVAVDGLWRVLCPSANSRTIHRLAKYTTSQQQILLTSTRPRGKQLYSEVRCEASCFPIYGTKAAKGAEQDSHSSHQLWQGKFTPGISEERPIWRYHDDNLETFDSFTEDDKSEFIQEIYERLRRNSILGYTDTVYKQVGHLVRYWRERPNKRIYQALLRVNVSHDMGNINRALDLLDEMDEADVSWDVELCQDLLAVCGKIQFFGNGMLGDGEKAEPVLDLGFGRSPTLHAENRDFGISGEALAYVNYY